MTRVFRAFILYFIRFEQAKLASIVAEAQETVHIGLKYISESDTFEWNSGEDVTVTNWGEDQPGRLTSKVPENTVF